MDKNYVYLDNAATSNFKPQTVVNALNYDLAHSANSGRSGHRLAVECAVKVENARSYLLDVLGSTGNLVFTKNCTEALNLAIFGYVKQGMRVVADANAHNSVLRPLFILKEQGVIDLFIVNQSEDGKIQTEHVLRAAENADMVVINAVSNVTGARADVAEIGRFTRKNGIILLVDSAQAIPIIDIKMERDNVDMLALPGHKGLHGVQGTGLLAFRSDIELRPLLFGGTGTYSSEVIPPLVAPESYEAGTLFAGGIAALAAGAKWSYDNISAYRKNLKKLGGELLHYLKAIGAETYTVDPTVGVVSFNLSGLDSGYVADKLNERGFAVRSGLHCAPLVHAYLKTENRGAVRASLGVDNTEKDVYSFVSALEEIAADKKII